MANNNHYDVIIVGSGAGGGTLAHKLAPTGKKILILERGGYVPREKDNWNPRAVNLEGKYQTKEKWHDKDGNELHPHTMHPDGAKRIVKFTSEPWPKWIFALEDGTEVEQEIFVVNGSSIVALAWRMLSATEKATLVVTPFLSGRDYHSLHHENPFFQFHPETRGKQLIWRPYPGSPGIIAFHNGEYEHQPDWYRNFTYEQERQRGLDFTEDLAAPGAFRLDLTAGEGVVIFCGGRFRQCRACPLRGEADRALSR